MAQLAISPATQTLAEAMGRADALGGEFEIDFDPQGLRVEIVAPLSSTVQPA